MEVDDGILFPPLKPVIAGNEDVVFVGFAVAIFPLVILGARESPIQPTRRSGLISVRAESRLMKSMTVSRVS